MTDKELIKRLDNLIELLTPKPITTGYIKLRHPDVDALSVARDVAKVAALKSLPAIVVISGSRTNYEYGVATRRFREGTGITCYVRWTNGTTSIENINDLTFI